MSSRVITVSEGVAKLYGGSVLLRDVLYRLTRTVDDTAMVRPSAAAGPLEGAMDVGVLAEAVVLAGVEDLALQFDDGRRVAIALSSTSGRFAVRGVWITQPKRDDAEEVLNYRKAMRSCVAELEYRPLSQQILQFLVKHDGAMDTIDGVAKCWVNSDPVAVKSVLDSLQHAGVVVTRVLSSGTYYRLTTNVEVRAWLKTYCETCGRAQRALASSND